MMTTGLKDIIEAYEVTLNIGIRIRDTVTDTSLGRKVYDNGYFVFRKKPLYSILIRNRSADKSPVPVQGCYFLQTLVLDIDIIIVGDGVDTDHSDITHIMEKTFDKITADKAGSTCYEHRLAP